MFKMRDSLSSARYSPVCNVLRQWKTALILTYRPKKHFLNEQISKDAVAKKTPNTSGIGKINNYYEDIYIPPYNNTD